MISTTAHRPRPSFTNLTSPSASSDRKPRSIWAGDSPNFFRRLATIRMGRRSVTIRAETTEPAQRAWPVFSAMSPVSTSREGLVLSGTDESGSVPSLESVARQEAPDCWPLSSPLSASLLPSLSIEIDP